MFERVLKKHVTTLLKTNLVTDTFAFFNKNIVYKNIEAEIC